MADSRRSSRARKEVDYSAYGGGGEESDDGDFTEPTPPPAKKPREDKKKPKKKRSSRDVDDDYDEFKETSRGKRKDRKPVEDRMFDRELELALEMSKQESSQEANDGISSAPIRKAKEVSAIVHSAPPLLPACSDDQENESSMPVLLNEEAESGPSPVTDSPVKQSPVKTSPARLPKVKKSPPKKISAPTKRTPTATPAPAKRTPSISRGGLVKRSAPPSKPLVSTTPKTNSNVTLASPRTVALKRPAPSPSSGSGNNPLGGVKLVSPGVPIRLGLSKFARIKPLHGNVKV